MATVLHALTAVGSAMVAGVLVAFSVAVMPALRRRPAAHAIAMMQEVNRVIVGPVFLLLFLGTALACVGTVLLAPGAATVAAAALYLVGAFGVTAVVNVPLNNALDTVDATAAGCERDWERFHVRWTRWNHVRALAATAAAVTLVL